MINKCINCKENKEIVWSDTDIIPSLSKEKKTQYDQINLCGDCLIYCMPEESKKLRSCNKCGKKFVARFEWARTCFPCYIKLKNKK